MTLDLLRHLADRYDVSLTAAALKWVESTADCAVVVVATNGFINWFRRSTAADRMGLFFRPGTALPDESVAARGEAVANDCGIDLPAGVWCNAPVREVAIFADRYEMTISLLIVDVAASDRWAYRSGRLTRLWGN